MADNNKPAPVAKTAKSVEVSEDIRIETPTFNPYGPALIAKAEGMFRSRVAEKYGAEAQLDNVMLKGIDHHVGTAATYHYVARIAVNG